MAGFTDADLFEALQHNPDPVASAQQLADDLDVSRQAVDQRLRKLHDTDQVQRVDLGRDVGWYLAPGSQEAENNGLVGRARTGDGFAVDITDEETDASLLVQAGPNGYQLDLWWTDDGEKRQSSNWVRFDGRDPDYPHDNRHTRQPALSTSYHGLTIHDPDPRAPPVGYEGARLTITRQDNGLEARLEWVDEYDQQHEETAIAPFADPRHDRDTYYTLLDQSA